MALCMTQKPLAISTTLLHAVQRACTASCDAVRHGACMMLLDDKVYRGDMGLRDACVRVCRHDLPEGALLLRP